MWLHIPESCLSVPASGCSTLAFDSPCPALGRSATWRGKSRPPRSWRRVCEMEAFTRLLSGLTSPRSVLELGALEWISSLEASPASHSPAPASARGSKTSDGSGATSPGSSKSVGLKPFSLKMSLGLFDMALPPSCQTLPRSGIMLHGIVSEHPTWERRIVESECSSSAFPTPSATSYGNNRGGAAGRVGPIRPSLESIAKDWPTATARDWKDGACQNANVPENALLGRVAANWPTPRTITGGAESAERKKELGRKNSGGGDLQAAANNWATPMASDGSKPSAGNRRSADLSHQAQATENPGSESRPKLNPRFVEWLMGVPLGWTAFEPVETASFRRWLRSHGASS